MWFENRSVEILGLELGEKEKKKKGKIKSQISQLISFTSVWIQLAGGWRVCFTASSNIPSRSNRPGLEHIENPPTTDTLGIKKSTLKIDQKQKLKKKPTTPNMENNNQNKMAAFVSIILPWQRHLHFPNITFPKKDLILSNAISLKLFSSRNMSSPLLNYQVFKPFCF